MRPKKNLPKKVYIGARVPLDLKSRLAKRAQRERRPESYIIETLLTKELATE